MNPRRTRLMLLAADLRATIEALAQGLEARSAAVFLDVLQRIEAYPAGEVRAAGLGPLLEAAREARAREPRLGPVCARALDLDGLVARTSALTERDAVTSAPEEVAAWANDVLLVANLVGAFDKVPQPRVDQARMAVLDAASSAEAFPGAFEAAAAVANDRFALEHPEAARGDLYRTALDAFRVLALAPRPEQVAPASARHTAEVLREALERIPPARRGSVQEGFRSAQAFVAERDAGVPALLALAAQGAGRRVALVAADADTEREVLLWKSSRGEFTLHWDGRALSVRWSGQGRPTLKVATKDGVRALRPRTSRGEVRWLLDERSLRGLTKLVAEVGGRSVVLFQLRPPRKR